MAQENLKKKILQIDKKGYKAYRILAGVYSFPKFKLFIDHVQGDPFAAPSKIRIRAGQDLAKFPLEYFKNEARKTAFEDFIARGIALAISHHVKGNRGTGKSGLIEIQKCGQEVLKRTSVLATTEYIEARLSIGLPARGRTILGKEALEMSFGELPKVVEDSLFFARYDPDALKNHVDLYEDQEFLRKKLADRRLVAFVADGSILPRESGISDKPMSIREAVPFHSPSSLRVIISLPHRGKRSGMGIPEGVTLIVGGGYHGKTTLLKAIEKGVYNHIPGDGRELVITRGDAVKIRAEDGRRIEKVNISPFIQNLPMGKSTSAFCTDDASGSTSQAANIMEALETGTRLLLIDEDTSATNFMIRDERMQSLVAKEKEPITPFIDKARLLYHDLGISSIIVIGGSGDYFDVANTVIMMDEYRPRDVTQRAKEIARTWAAQRICEGGTSFGEVTPRIPLKTSFQPKAGKKIKVKGEGKNLIRFGRRSIDLSCVEQLVDGYQTDAIAQILLYISQNYIDDRRTLKEIIQVILRDISEKGLDILSAFKGHPGEFALPRGYEIAAAINRMRTLKVRVKTEKN
ncbi:MAG: ABC-ATPase domain-containing protein [Actinomycetota bacterium]